MRKPHFFESALTYTVSNVANAAVPFLLLPLLTRVLTTSEYGVISMFMAVTVMLGAFTSLNVQSAVLVRYFEMKAVELGRYIASCLTIQLASSLLVFVIVWTFRHPLAVFTSVPQEWLLLAVAVAGFSSVIQLQLGLWTAMERPRVYGGFQIGRTLLDITLSLFLVLVLLMGFEGRLWGRVVAAVLFGVLTLYTLVRVAHVLQGPRQDHVRDALAYGVPLVPHTVGLFLISAGDRFIVNMLIGIEETGIFTVAVQIGLGFAVVTDAINRAFVPWLYRSLREGHPEVMRKIVSVTWVYFVIILLVAGIVALLSEWIVSLLAGREFVRAAGPLVWLVLGQAFHGMYLMVTNYLFFTGRTGRLSLTTITIGALSLCLTYFLVPMYGINGAGMAFAMAMFLRFVLIWILAHRAYPMPWRLVG